MKAIIARVPIIGKLGPFSVSMAVHVVVIWLLMALGVLRVDLLLDRDQARAQSQEASARQAAREAKERARRQRMKLNEEHAAKLKKEADRVTKRRLRAHVVSLRAKYQQIKQLKSNKLTEIKRRTSREIENRALDNLRARAETLARESSNLNRRYRHAVRGEVADLAKQAAETTGKFLEQEQDGKTSSDEIGKQLSKDASNVESRASDAAAGLDVDGSKSRTLAYPEDKQVHHLAQQFQAAVKRAVGDSPDLKKFNDTSSARPFDDGRFADAATLDAPGDLYQLAKELEQEIAAHYDDFRTGELALGQNTTFDDAKAKLAGVGTPQRPDLEGELDRLQDQLGNAGGEGDQGPVTMSDLTEYRQTLGRANSVAGQMDLRAGNLLSQALGLDGNGALRALLAQGSLQGQGQADLSSLMGALYGLPGHGPGSGPIWNQRFHMEIEGGRFMRHVDNLPGIRIPRKKIFAEAMTGRRFSRDSARKGWLYVDTWYLIGPWENHGRIDYSVVHPPENGIDFDATYYDGKRGRELRWEYIHSNSIRVIPKNAPGDSTWYAYTELYFDEPMEMLLAVASDDATKVWINNQVVWQENGLSQWSMGEGVRKVLFKQGTNTVLIRVENGPGETIFSMVVCPPEAVRDQN